ncbi:hypothetical protein KKG72_07320 [bacterium]|nr:hypothetical protein [bacterium]MBU1994057.1 hypothetical protein [bacterium]
MKKIILAMALILGSLQAGDVVHYDTKETKKPEITKPNHPNSDIYTQK